jgi:hypothetical protein
MSDDLAVLLGHPGAYGVRRSHERPQIVREVHGISVHTVHGQGQLLATAEVRLDPFSHRHRATISQLAEAC